MTVAAVFKGVSEGGTRIGRVHLEQPPKRAVWHCKELVGTGAGHRKIFEAPASARNGPPWGRTPHEKRAAKPNRSDSLSDLAERTQLLPVARAPPVVALPGGHGLGMAQRNCLGLGVSSVPFTPQHIATSRCQDADPLRCSVRAVPMTYNMVTSYGYSCRGIPTTTTLIVSVSCYHLHSANFKVVKPLCNAV